MSRTKSTKRIKGLIIVTTSLLVAPVGAIAATSPAEAPLGSKIEIAQTSGQPGRTQLAQLDITIGQEVCDRFDDTDCNPPGFQKRDENGGAASTNFY